MNKLIFGFFLVILSLSFVSSAIYNCSDYENGTSRFLGDLDGDADVDVDDTLAIFEVLGDVSLIEGDIDCVDANEDGVLDGFDFAIIDEIVEESEADSDSDSDQDNQTNQTTTNASSNISLVAFPTTGDSQEDGIITFEKRTEEGRSLVPLIIGVVIFLILVGAGFAIYYFMKKKKEESPQEVIQQPKIPPAAKPPITKTGPVVKTPIPKLPAKRA